MSPDTAVAAAAAVVTGSTTSEQLVRRCLEAAAADRLNAFASWDADDALDQARRADRAARAGDRRPLLGVPVVVKDNIDVAGLPTACGTRAWTALPARRDAEVVARLRAAGAVVVAKTSMHELALGATGLNAATGDVRNPHDPRRWAGGSSGGTAAAVACGAAPAGLGTDTGGSVRVPSALCGAAGLRPTWGRYPGSGVVGLSATRDTVGPVARTVDDLVLLDGVLAAAPGAPGTAEPAVPDVPRPVLGVLPEEELAGAAPAVVALYRRWQLALADAGAVLVTVSVQGTARAEEEAGLAITLFEARQVLRARADEEGTSLDELVGRVDSVDVRGLLLDHVVASAPHPVGEQEYRRALDGGRAALRAALRSPFDEHRLDALLRPTTPTTAGPVPGAVAGAEAGAGFTDLIRHTSAPSILGWPGTTQPAGTDELGLPVGLALDALPGQDRALLGLARWTERVLAGALGAAPLQPGGGPEQSVPDHDGPRDRPRHQ